MAEETQKKPVAVEAAPVKETAKETVVASPAQTPAPESEVKEVEKPAAPASAEEPAAPASAEEPAAPASAEEPAAAAPPTEEAEEKKIGESPSFKEESNIVSELPELQRKALEELKKLVQEALNKHEFTAPPTPPAPCPAATEEEKNLPAEETAVETKDKAAAGGGTSEETAVKAVEISVEKTEDKKPAVEEKKEEKKPGVEEKKEEKKPATVVEEKKEEKKPATAAVEDKKEEKKPAAVVEEKKEKDVPITLSEVINKETTTTVKDGAKTVEPISESVVPISATTDPTSKTEETPKEEDIPVVVDAPPPPPPEEVFMWGIPLLGDDRSDVILLKFLRARDFKVKETLAMIKKCVRWRKEFGIDSLLDEDLGNDYEKVVFTHGCDKQGRPVVYNVFGEFNDKDLYQLAFSDVEKQKKFLKWLVQFVERTVRRFEFSPEGMNSFLIVNDLKNSPGYGKRELHKIFGKYMMLLQDNYPEFVSKQVCINVSFWYLAYSWVYVNVLSPRSKSKFVFATSSKTPDTLFRYISPEQVPVQYGGHSRAGELEFTPEEPVTEITIKPSSSHPIEFTFTEPCALVWELRVVGWDVTYEAQFVPEEGYTVLVTKPKKMSPINDDPILCDSFKVSQPGKLVITIDNHSSKKKKLLYRSKVKTAAAIKTTTETTTTA